MNNTILYVSLAFLVALFVSIFFYFYKQKNDAKRRYVLFLLRFIALFSIVLLLINPTWEKRKLFVEKPNLVVAVDNSASIKYLNAADQVTKLIDNIKQHTALQKKFTVNYLRFGSTVQNLDSLDFSDTQTNPGALLEQVNTWYKSGGVPVVLITDGNQTYGTDYAYYNSKNRIYPIVVGDTVQYQDLAITQLNVNPYSVLDNQFPVEIFSVYSGNNTVHSQLNIYLGKKRVFSKTLVFDALHQSHRTQIKLKAEKLGTQFYRAVLSPITNEKNTRNNTKHFSVEVIDQTAKILLLSSFYHPDLGAIKKSIERNKQRKVVIKVGAYHNIKLPDYQLVILYQPTASLASVLDDCKKLSLNTFIITGTHTDWTFLNQAQSSFHKETTRATESYFPVYNPDFSEFMAKDIGFNRLPPVEGFFGTVQFQVPYQSLLNQKIASTTTQHPLLATYEAGNQKNVVLFGEGIWKWRMQSSLIQHNSKVFDHFLGNLIQYAAKHKEYNRMRLTYDKLVYSNQEQRIRASLVDQNYQTDMQENLWLSITSKNTHKTRKIPFIPKDNEYEVVLNDLQKGLYTFKVNVAGKKEMHYGSFTILDYNIEQSDNTADIDRLQRLTYDSKGILATVDHPENVFQSLLHDSAYKAIQKNKKIKTPIIDWYWLLGIIIVSLSAEWLIRKYSGLI